ncbi:transcription elongation GreA/GreB family factor [Mycobacterium sp. URHB0021]|jgi:transcription elongation factor GreA
MTTAQGVWMTRRAYIRLQAELAGLRSQPAIEVPDDFMDYDNNVVAAYRARQARIGQIHDLLANAIVGEDPPDDGVAEPGMVLTVRYDDTGDTETFLLGVRGAEDADIEVYSAQSPLGSAIVGARPGEQRTYSIPSKDTVPVTLLDAVPHGLCAHRRFRPQPVSRIPPPSSHTHRPALGIETRPRKTTVRGSYRRVMFAQFRARRKDDNDQYPTCLDITAGLPTATVGRARRRHC